MPVWEKIYGQIWLCDLTDVANDCVRMGFLVVCCLYNYFGGSIINQHHWLNDLYKKKEKKRAKFWNFFETFFDNLTEKVQQQIDNVQKEKTKKEGGKNQGVGCDGFLHRTHAPRTSRSRFARTHVRTPILWWSHFAPAPAPLEGWEINSDPDQHFGRTKVPSWHGKS